MLLRRGTANFPVDRRCQPFQGIFVFSSLHGWQLLAPKVRRGISAVCTVETPIAPDVSTVHIDRTSGRRKKGGPKQDRSLEMCPGDYDCALLDLTGLD